VINEIFDKVYCLNLPGRPERMKEMERRFQFAGIKFERFNAISGDVVKFFHRHSPQFFSNPNYVACALSHLSIYKTAIDRGEKRILIVEDDVKIHREANSISNRIPAAWDLLYLAYIPLSDDMTRWDYNIVPYTAERVFSAKNLWSLMGYGINEKLMRHLIEVYADSFPMELDRYFVQYIQPSEEFVSIGISPQIFCAEDGYSDNSGRNETGMMERSVDIRFAKYTDYV
jgi:GR25 family glycosyltransferase involved in LPS biosynthesis